MAPIASFTRNGSISSLPRRLPNCFVSATIDGMSEADRKPNAESPGASPFAQHLHVPQFGILHLLLWIAAAAVLLKLFIGISQHFNQPLPPVQYWIGQFAQAACAIVMACALVGSGVLLRLRCYKMLKRLQPGHWLLLMETLAFLISLVSLLFIFVCERSTAAMIACSNCIRITIYFYFGVSAVAFGYAYYHLRDTRPWKTVIGAKWIGALAEVALSVLAFFTSLLPHAFTSALDSGWITAWGSTAWSGLVFLFLLYAAFTDLRNRADRDWVHWLGVAVLAFVCMKDIFDRVYFTFFLAPG